MKGGDTWLDGAKERVAEQKRLFRNTGVGSAMNEMLKIGDTNFLITERQARMVLSLEFVGADLRSSYEEGVDDWLWCGDICNLVKIHQLGCGNPANYRGQFLEALKGGEGGKVEKPKDLIGKL